MASPLHKPLTEKYRPATWAEVVGQQKTVERIRQLADRAGLCGRAFFITGQSGTGKTTIARLIAQEVAGEWDVEELDAGALTVASLRDLERNLSFRGMGDKGGRAVIVNEAHGLRKDVIRAPLVMLERIPPHALRVFTSTVEGTESLFEDYDDAWPLLSRCLRLDLARRDLAKARADLVFRVHRLRKTVAKRVALTVVCPVENGATGHRTDCGRCRLCIN